jgi:hypothetical protein
MASGTSPARSFRTRVVGPESLQQCDQKISVPLTAREIAGDRMRRSAPVCRITLRPSPA